ncbi:metallophosphoesterase family protein [Chloroflexota bacterium]
MGTPSQKKPFSRLYEFPSTAKRIFVVGDLHGDLCSYKTVVNSWQKEKGSNLVFLGDYADRGPQGLEIIESLMKLSKEDGIVVLKGNHEDYSNSGQPLFYPCDLRSEVTEKRGSWDSYFSQYLKPFFKGLYVSAMLPGKILFVHGGISNRIEDIDSLRYPAPETEKDILWSDPGDSPGEEKNPRGLGFIFGKDVTDRILKHIVVDVIIRSHEPKKTREGPYSEHNRMIVTISSTNAYERFRRQDEPHYRPHYLELKVDEVPEILADPVKFSHCVRYIEQRR